ncbi:MAG TPA: imelysin family protein, partial [Vicingus sp.]|nr:imelysin family protein [Vicingus sp.]
NGSYVFNEWINTYRTDFISNSASNAQGSSVSNLVNALNSHYETYIRKGKIGLPSGVFNGFSQAPMPNHVEALYFKQSLPYVYRSLSSFKKFLNGNSYTNNTSGKGFDDYLTFVNAVSGGIPLETAINNQMVAIDNQLATINDPLSNEVLVNNQGVKDVYQQMQLLVPKLKVEMTDALGVLITYQDNDGD